MIFTTFIETSIILITKTQGHYLHLRKKEKEYRPIKWMNMDVLTPQQTKFTKALFTETSTQTPHTQESWRTRVYYAGPERSTLQSSKAPKVTEFL